MRRGVGQVGRVWLGVAVAAAVVGLGGCAMTPRDEFFQSRSLTFKAVPGQAGTGATGLAAGTGSSDLAAAFGATR